MANQRFYRSMIQFGVGEDCDLVLVVAKEVWTALRESKDGAFIEIEDEGWIWTALREAKEGDFVERTQEREGDFVERTQERKFIEVNLSRIAGFAVKSFTLDGTALGDQPFCPPDEG